MEHKDIEAEIKKRCEKCGYSGKEFPHVVCHRPPKTMYFYGGSPLSAPITATLEEAMVFTCTRCCYNWEVKVT